MKRLLFVLVVFLVVLAGCVEISEPEENNGKQGAEQPSQEEVELTREDELDDIITEKIKSDYNSTTIKGIRINEDLGSGKGYIVLIDLSFDAKNRANTAKDMIDMYASDLAATLAKQKDVNEVVSFWEVPYLQSKGNVIKIATERSGNDMAFTEKWFDPSIFE